MILRRNYDQNAPENVSRPLPEHSNAEYQILLEFDLKREKQKNLILEERLKNKELFIQQMKHFQQELTVAYEQCKNQLVLSQQKIEYLQNVEFRNYTEQIADLKHMLMTKNNHQSKRQSLGKEERYPLGNISNKVSKSKTDRTARNSPKKQSKIVMNVLTQREGQDDKLEREIKAEIKKVSNFIFHFLQMSQYYLKDNKQERLSKKLKKSWKWIKQIVKQWDQSIEKIRLFQQLKQTLSKLYGANKDVELEQLIQLIHQKQPINK